MRPRPSLEHARVLACLPAARVLIGSRPLTPRAFEPRARTCSFMSLPQRGYTTSYDKDKDDRSEYERLRFNMGLKGINIW